MVEFVYFYPPLAPYHPRWWCRLKLHRWITGRVVAGATETFAGLDCGELAWCRDCGVWKDRESLPC